LTDQVTSVP